MMHSTAGGVGGDALYGVGLRYRTWSCRSSASSFIATARTCIRYSVPGIKY